MRFDQCPTCNRDRLVCDGCARLLGSLATDLAIAADVTGAARIESNGGIYYLCAKCTSELLATLPAANKG